MSRRDSELLDAATSQPSTSTEVELDKKEIIYQLIDQEHQIQKIIAELKEEKLLAVDCEGVKLGRDGSLTMLQISSDNSPCHLFDILKLGRRPFDLGLKSILEDKTITKLMFDCKEDSDALAHLYHVTLDGVYDIQLYEVMYRDVALEGEKISEPKVKRGWHSRLPRRSGMNTCIKRYLKDERLLNIKEQGRDLLVEEKTIWGKRPIAKKLLEYAAVETRVIFLLFNHFNKCLPLSDPLNRQRLEISSERFANYFRELPTRTYDQYERNSLLLLNVIPNVVRGRVDTTLPRGDTQCSGCKKFFPRGEFTRNQLQLGNQKCRVCKEEKRLQDVQSNRQKNR